ncbi:hypothetical protein NQ176_g3725 [Zarea fungicola]|uniref:Uncharacterized protein n=1 Tax=Zarea fungicola TaxID=93591 RepID=A0ACC1NJ91_9HYPO|nr:hypothetical protein NQ176_g3725 [Lecanicillium fungicola]
MKYSAIIAAALATTGVSAWAKNGTEPTKYETTVVTAYTTYCPGPTLIPIHGNKTITVTAATTLTITGSFTRPYPDPEKKKSRDC